MRTVNVLIPLPPHRSQLLPRGPRFPLSVSLRLPLLGQLPFGLPGSEARLPPIGLGLLGAGPKLRPGLFGRRDPRLQPGLARARRLAGLRHLLLRRPAHPVQLPPGRLSRLPRLPSIGLGLLGAGPKLRPGLFGRRDPRLQPGLARARRLAGLRHLLLRRPAHPVQLPPGRLSRLPRTRRVLPGLAGPGLGPGRPGLRTGYRLVPLPPHRSQLLPHSPRLLLSGGLRLPRLPRIGRGPLGAGLKPRPGLLSRRDLRLRHPAHPVQLHLSRLSPGHPGLRTRYRLVPLPPHRSQLLPHSPRLLLSGGLRLPRLPRIGRGPLGAGLKPRPGLLSRRDLRLRHPAHPVQLHLSRLSPGHPGLRTRYRLVPLPPHRSQLLPHSPRLLLSGGLRLPRLPRIGRGPLGAGLKPRPGLLSRRDLRLRHPAHPVQLHLSRLSPGHPGLRTRYRLVPLPPHRSQLLPHSPRLLLSGGLRLPRLPRIGRGPLGAGLKPRPGLLSRRDLRLRHPAHPVQLRPGRLSRLPRPRRVLPGLAGPDTRPPDSAPLPPRPAPAAPQPAAPAQPAPPAQRRPAPPAPQPAAPQPRLP